MSNNKPDEKKKKIALQLHGHALDLAQAALAFCYADQLAEIEANAEDELTQNRLEQTSAEFDAAMARVLELLVACER